MALNKPDTTNKTDEKADEPSTPSTGAPSSSLDPQRVVIEQAEPEPAVFYGPEGGQVPGAPSEPVKADYQPFSW